MENIIKVAENKDEIAGLPPHLKGLRVGDVLIIKNFPDTRKYPEFARYLNGVCFYADEFIKYNIAAGNDYITIITGEDFSVAESKRSENTLRSNGYTGDIQQNAEVKIYADMVEFLNKPVAETKESKRILYSIVCNDKRQGIIDEMISKVDVARIRKIFNISLGRGRTPRDDLFNKFLHDWATAKYEFYLAFGRSLTISTDISFKVDETEMQGMVYGLYYKFPKYAATLEKITKNGMGYYVENKMPKVDFFSHYMPEIYKSGMNISKFLSHLFVDSDFDVEFSKVMQDREIKGKIVISIDPYDYLTSATNMHGWSSCHRIDGDMHGGSYTYIIDNATLVAYRDNGRTYQYGNGLSEDDNGKSSFNFGKNAFQGNSKSWRQFVHVDKSTCAALFSREYPQHKEIGGVRETARTLLETTISNYLGIPNNWDNYGDIENLATTKIFGTTLYTDDTLHHYSDIANWSKLIREYPEIRKALVMPENTDISKVNIHVGGELHCFICGKKIPKEAHVISCC